MSDLDDLLDRIAAVCEAAAAGDLEARVLGVPDEGAARRVALAINHLLDVSDARRARCIRQAELDLPGAIA